MTTENGCNNGKQNCLKYTKLYIQYENISTDKIWGKICQNVNSGSL